MTKDILIGLAVGVIVAVILRAFAPSASPPPAVYEAKMDRLMPWAVADRLTGAATPPNEKTVVTCVYDVRDLILESVKLGVATLRSESNSRNEDYYSSFGRFGDSRLAAERRAADELMHAVWPSFDAPPAPPEVEPRPTVEYFAGRLIVSHDAAGHATVAQKLANMRLAPAK